MGDCTLSSPPPVRFSTCTALPKLVSPTNVASLLSCSAPAVISLALALLASIKTTSLPCRIILAVSGITTVLPRRSIHGLALLAGAAGQTEILMALTTARVTLRCPAPMPPLTLWSLEGLGGFGQTVSVLGELVDFR